MAMSMTCSSAPIICSRSSATYMHFPVLSLTTAKRPSFSYKTNSSKFPTLKNFNGECQYSHFFSMHNFNLQQPSTYCFEITAKKRIVSKMDTDEEAFKGYTKLPNGIYYKDTVYKAQGKIPESKDQVLISYRPYKESTEQFDEVRLDKLDWISRSARRIRNSPFRFHGFVEVILTMKCGGKRTVLIPKENNSSLEKLTDYEIYDVTLMEIVPFHEV